MGGWYSRLAARRQSRVAQLAEQPAVNRQVTGSSPVAGASLEELAGQRTDRAVRQGALLV